MSWKLLTGKEIIIIKPLSSPSENQFKLAPSSLLSPSSLWLTQHRPRFCCQIYCFGLLCVVSPLDGPRITSTHRPQLNGAQHSPRCVTRRYRYRYRFQVPSKRVVVVDGRTNQPSSAIPVLTINCDIIALKVIRTSRWQFPESLTGPINM